MIVVVFLEYEAVGKEEVGVRKRLSICVEDFCSWLYICRSDHVEGGVLYVGSLIRAGLVR